MLVITTNTTKLEINYIEWREMNVIFSYFQVKLKVLNGSQIYMSLLYYTDM